MSRGGRNTVVAINVLRRVVVRAFRPGMLVWLRIAIPPAGEVLPVVILTPVGLWTVRGKIPLGFICCLVGIHPGTVENGNMVFSPRREALCARPKVLLRTEGDWRTLLSARHREVPDGRDDNNREGQVTGETERLMIFCLEGKSIVSSELADSVGSLWWQEAGLVVSGESGRLGKVEEVVERKKYSSQAQEEVTYL